MRLLLLLPTDSQQNFSHTSWSGSLRDSITVSWIPFPATCPAGPFFAPAGRCNLVWSEAHILGCGTDACQTVQPREFVHFLDFYAEDLGLDCAVGVIGVDCRSFAPSDRYWNCGLDCRRVFLRCWYMVFKRSNEPGVDRLYSSSSDPWM